MLLAPPRRVAALSREQSGTVFKGDWVNDERHGKGTTIFDVASGTQGAFPADTASGDRHEGEYHEDTIAGAGVWYYADGRKYVGIFKDGQFHGEGTLYAAEIDGGGAIRGPGQWARGVYDDKEEREKREQLRAESERRAAALQAAVDAVNASTASPAPVVEPWKHEHKPTEIQTYVLPSNSCARLTQPM